MKVTGPLLLEYGCKKSYVQVISRVRGNDHLVTMRLTHSNIQIPFLNTRVRTESPQLCYAMASCHNARVPCALESASLLISSGGNAGLRGDSNIPDISK